MSQCPFKQTAVQQHFEVKRSKADFDEAAMERARCAFGQCDREECQMWQWLKAGEEEKGWCGLMNNE